MQTYCEPYLGNLDFAEEQFKTQPTKAAAAAYLRALAIYFDDGMIGDNTFMHGVERVATWLMETS